MSVTDPLLKELKGSVQQILLEDRINDVSPNLLTLCEQIERIFYKGLVLRSDFCTSPWVWLNTVEIEMQRGGINRVFSYANSVEETRNNKRVKTNRGKFRLLTRLCLVHKCLHIPVDIMVRQIGNRKQNWYNESGILGHEVLGEILLSVVLQISQLNFSLDVSNARFLDYTWQLPEMSFDTFVPCHSLGIVVTFLNDLAVIVEVEKGSVAAEDNKIEVGDVLDELNHEIVNEDLQGRLKNILGKCRNQPINVKVLKIHCQSPEKAYSTCLFLFRNSSKLAHLCNKSTNAVKSGDDKTGLMYLGSCSIGKRGDVTQVESGIRKVKESEQDAVSVTVEFQELHLIISNNGKHLMKHSFITISSCAHSFHYPNHFAYLVGDAPCSSDTEYTCHVFRAISKEISNNVLFSLGLGFERTNCSV